MRKYTGSARKYPNKILYFRFHQRPERYFKKVTDPSGVDVLVSSHLKEELAWAVDKRLRIISTIMVFKIQPGKSTKELKGTKE